MYEVKIYVTDDVHYVKVDDEGLEGLRDGLGDDTASTYIEVDCQDDGSVFAIRREMVIAYSYKEVTE